MFDKTKKLLGGVLVIVFAISCILPGGFVSYAADAQADVTGCLVVIGGREYRGDVNPIRKTITVDALTQDLTVAELAEASVTIESKAEISPAADGAEVDLNHPVAYTLTAEDGKTETYTLRVEASELMRGYDAEGAALNASGYPDNAADESGGLASDWTRGSGNAAYAIGNEVGNRYIQITGGSQSSYVGSVLNSSAVPPAGAYHETMNGYIVDKFAMELRFRLESMPEANDDMIRISAGHLDQVVLRRESADSYSLWKKDVTNTGMTTAIDYPALKTGSGAEDWHTLRYVFRRYGAISGTDMSWYAVELYLDGAFVTELNQGAYKVTDSANWHYTGMGRFTNAVGNYAQLKLELVSAFSGGVIGIDDFRITFMTDWTPGDDGPVLPGGDIPTDTPTAAPSESSTPEPPEEMEGPVDLEFEHGGLGWDMQPVNIIPNAGFETDEIWRKGTTDQAEVSYVTDKVYSGSRAHLMEFPEGRENNSYGAFRNYNVYTINPFSTYDISMMAIPQGIEADSRHNAQLSFRTSNEASGNTAIGKEEGGYCITRKDADDWTLVRGRYMPAQADERYITQLCSRMRGGVGSKCWFDDLFFGTVERVVESGEEGMSGVIYSGRGAFQLGGYNKLHGDDTTWSTPVPVSAGKTYRFAVKTKNDSERVKSCAALRFVDSSGGVLLETAGKAGTYGSWTEIEVLQTAPQGAAGVCLGLSAEGAGLATFDNASFEMQESIPTEFAGIVGGRLGINDSADKKVEFSAVVLDQFGAQMEIEPEYSLVEPVPGISLSKNTLTVTPAAKPGVAVRVKLSAGVLEREYEWVLDSLRAFAITGPDRVMRPDKQTQLQYAATVTNAAGKKEIIPGGNLLWEMEEELDGVSIEKDGTLTVTSGAPLGVCVLKATWLEDESFTATREIEIYRKATAAGGSGSGGGGGEGGGAFMPPVTAAPSAPPAVEPLYTDIPKGHWCYDAVKELTELGAVNGRDEKLFDGDSSITRAEFVKMLLLTAEITVPEGVEAAFEDVTEEQWHYPYIMSAYRLGMVQGKTEREFRPDERITREEAAAVIFRTLTAAGIHLEGVAGGFTDERDISAFAKEAAAALAENGVITGMEDGSFRPAAYLTRAQAAALLSRFYHLLP